MAYGFRSAGFAHYHQFFQLDLGSIDEVPGKKKIFLKSGKISFIFINAHMRDFKRSNIF